MKLWQPRSAASRLVRPGEYSAGGVGPGRQLPARFVGPAIPDQSATALAPITPIETAARFYFPPPVVGPIQYGLSGAPAGVAIDLNTGRISGTPAAAGSFPGSYVQAVDNRGRVVNSNLFNWTVV